MAQFAPLWAATVNQPETWDDGTLAGWVSYDLINERDTTSLSVENSALKLVFKQQWMTRPPEDFLIKADSDASAGRFTGNYISNAVMGISFRVYLERRMDIRVSLYNAQTRRLWRYRVPSVRTGEWVSVNVPVDPVILRNVNGVNGWAAYAQDLQNVSWVGVAVERNSSMNAQVFRMDDFMLVGAGPDFVDWMKQFVAAGSGGQGQNALPGSDFDGDGVDNYSEWIAGTSPNDRREFFKVALGKKEAGGIGLVLEWKSQQGRQYAVWRTTNLLEPFIRISSDLNATPPLNRFEDVTATGKGPYFYKVLVNKAP